MNGMVDVATEYGVLLSMDMDLRTILYFISSAHQKRLNRENQKRLEGAAASNPLPRRR